MCEGEEGVVNIVVPNNPSIMGKVCISFGGR